MKSKLNKFVRSKYPIYLLLVVITLILVFLLMGARAYIPPVVTGETTGSISISNCANVYYTDSGNSIYLENSYPVSDNIGLQNDSYDFTISNSCDTSQNISVLVVLNSDSSISAEEIKTYYGDNAETKLLSSYSDVVLDDYIEEQYTSLTENTAKNIYLLETYTVSSNDSKDLSLTLWLDFESTDTANKTFSATVIAVDEQYVSLIK